MISGKEGKSRRYKNTLFLGKVCNMTREFEPKIHLGVHQLFHATYAQLTRLESYGITGYGVSRPGIQN